MGHRQRFWEPYDSSLRLEIARLLMASADRPLAIEEADAG